VWIPPPLLEPTRNTAVGASFTSGGSQSCGPSGCAAKIASIFRSWALVSS